MVYLDYYMTYKQTPWDEGHIATQYVRGPTKKLKRNANGKPVVKEDGSYVYSDFSEEKPRLVGGKKVTKKYNRYREVKFSFLPGEFEW